MNQVLKSEDIIADTLQRGPELDRADASQGWRFTRWRQFVGSYSLPALPSPLFVVQLAGKTDVRIWDRDGWSEGTSFPGAATIVPAGRATRWLVDGELDVATFSLEKTMSPMTNAERFGQLRFAYTDPLGAALAQQIIGELYARKTGQDNGYLSCLANTLAQHVSMGPRHGGVASYPTTGFSSFRIHTIINMINDDPAAEHSLQDLAMRAGITESHLCRVFKQSVGCSPHQYLVEARLNKSVELLGQSKLPMSRIAELSGFSGQCQFARSFKQRFGETPTSFRRRALTN